MAIVRMETPEDKAPRFPSKENEGTTLTHTVHFRRPDTPYSLSKMTAPNEWEATTQIHRLEAPGCTVVDVIPPITGGLTQTTQNARDDFSGADTTARGMHSA